jgi:hypothetical protein
MHPADPPPELPPPLSRAELREELKLVWDFTLLPAVGVVVFLVAYAIVTAGAPDAAGFYCTGGLDPLADVSLIYLGVEFIASLVLVRRHTLWMRVAIVVWNLLLTGFLLFLLFLMALTGGFGGVNCGA